MAVDVVAGDTEMFIEETCTVKNGAGAPNTVSGDICEAAKSKCHRLVNVLFTARLEVEWARGAEGLFSLPVILRLRDRSGILHPPSTLASLRFTHPPHFLDTA